MSVYTTEVRYICEYEAGLLESTGYNDIDAVVEKSWDKIFKKFPIFDETYRKTLCTKILNHYYTREIGAETVSLWKFWLNQKMNEIMPYYNKLYLTEQIKFDPLHEIDVTRVISEKRDFGKNGDETTNTTNTHNTKGTTSNIEQLESLNNSSAEATSTNSNEITNKNTTTGNETTTVDIYKDGKNLHSDTPQGSLKNISENGYLTDATITTDNSNNTEITDRSITENKTATGTETRNDTNSAIAKTTGKNSSTADSTTSDNANGETASLYSENGNESHEYSERTTGKNSSASYSKLINEYRDTLLNIDMKIILELQDLFLNIY